MLDEEKIETICVSFEVFVSDDDIDDIMCAALEGGINEWCSKVDVDGEYLGDYASDQISRGGKLIIYLDDGSAAYELTKEKFLEGLTLFIVENERTDVVLGGGLDSSLIDALDAGEIIQYAIFGEVNFC